MHTHGGARCAPRWWGGVLRGLGEEDSSPATDLPPFPPSSTPRAPHLMSSPHPRARPPNHAATESRAKPCTPRAWSFKAPPPLEEESWGWGAGTHTEETEETEEEEEAWRARRMLLGTTAPFSRYVNVHTRRAHPTRVLGHLPSLAVCLRRSIHPLKSQLRRSTKL